MRAPDDPYPDALAQIIHASIRGDHARAEAEMDKIRFVPLTRRTERWPAMSVIAKIYARIYGHVMPAMRQEAAGQIDAALGDEDQVDDEALDELEGEDD